MNTNIKIIESVCKDCGRSGDFPLINPFEDIKHFRCIYCGSNNTTQIDKNEHPPTLGVNVEEKIETKDKPA